MRQTHALAFFLAVFLVLTSCAGRSTEERAATPCPAPVRTPASAPAPSEPVVIHPVPMPTQTATPAPSPVSPPPAASPVLPPAAQSPAPAQAPAPTLPPVPPPPPAGPTDEAAIAAWRQAEEAYGWFYRTTLSHGPEARTSGGETYYPVEAPGMRTLADLQGYLKNCFSDEIVDALLPAGGAQYVELDGRLYVCPSTREPDAAKGEARLEVLRESSERLVIRAEVEVLDPAQSFAAVGVESHDYPYEQVGERWIFTAFYLYN